MLKLLFGAVLTIVLFFLCQKFYAKYTYPIFLPVLTTSIIISVLLVGLNIPYEVYMEGGDLLQKFLGPAVVALAYPLYNQRHLILKYKYAIIGSIFSAMFAGLISIVVFLKLVNASDTFIYTALPKSITTPVAMQISEVIGGIPPLSVVLVMVAGFTGAITCPLIFKWGGITSAIGRGVSVGSASHGVGLTRLKDYGEQELSMGSLAMGISAVVGSFICPIFAMLFLS